MLHEMRTTLFALAMLAASAPFAAAQSGQGLPPSDALYKTIAGLDATFFDAYNHCDLQKIGSMVSSDLEFYHDQTGLAVGRQSLLDGVKNNICGKVHRELVPGSLQVYPLKGYGAVEIGVHRFTHPDDPQAQGFGEAQFIHVWRLQDGTWSITRVISFDHHSVTP
ncbi:MAG: nuclear transport factor 2 family protein [Terracidiphilus sp.]